MGLDCKGPLHQRSEQEVPMTRRITTLQRTEQHAPGSEHARALVPLLASIAREVAERRSRVLTLERELEGTRDPSAGAPQVAEHQRASETAGSDARSDALIADLANQRRALRGLDRELRRLGCVLERGPAISMLIADRAGKPAWRWRQGEAEPRPLAPFS
jgi:hypothetical protein